MSDVLIESVTQDLTGSAVASPATWTRTISAGLTNSALLVGVICDGADHDITVNSLTFDAGGANTAMTKLGHVEIGSPSFVSLAFFLLKSPTPGTNIPFSLAMSASGYPIVASAVLTNVDQVTAINAASPQTADGFLDVTQPSIDITTAIGEMAFDLLFAAGVYDPTPGAGQSVLTSGALGAFDYAISSKLAAGGTTTNSYSGLYTAYSDKSWHQLGVSIRPAGAPATPAKLGITSAAITASVSQAALGSITVAVQTAGGATVAGATNPITASIVVHSGEAYLSGTTAQTPSGSATFPDLAVEHSEGAQFEVVFGATGLASATTGIITGTVEKTLTLTST